MSKSRRCKSSLTMDQLVLGMVHRVYRLVIGSLCCWKDSQSRFKGSLAGEWNRPFYQNIFASTITEKTNAHHFMVDSGGQGKSQGHIGVEMII